MIFQKYYLQKYDLSKNIIFQKYDLSKNIIFHKYDLPILAK